MNETYITKQETGAELWYLIDAENETLGRLASRISTVLLGKQKATYAPYLLMGDKVIVINAEKISISGKKETQKLYRSHSGRPGGMKTINFMDLQQKNPERIIEHAVKGMLPKGARGRELFRNLKVYKGNEHPHQAQTPELLN